MKPFIACILALTVAQAAEEVKKRGLAGVSLGYKQFDLGGPVELSRSVKDYGLPFSLGANYYLNNNYKLDDGGFGKTLKFDTDLLQNSHVAPKIDTPSFKGYHYVPPKQASSASGLEGFSSFKGYHYEQPAKELPSFPAKTSFKGYHYDQPQPQQPAGKGLLQGYKFETPADTVKLPAPATSPKFDASAFHGTVDATALQGLKFQAPSFGGKVDLSAIQSYKPQAPAQAIGSFQQPHKFEDSLLKAAPAPSLGGGKYDFTTQTGFNGYNGYNFNSKPMVQEYNFNTYSASKASPSFDVSAFKYQSGGGFGGNAVAHIDAKELGFSDDGKFTVQGHQQAFQAPSFDAAQHGQQHQLDSYQEAALQSHQPPSPQPSAPTEYNSKQFDFSQFQYESPQQNTQDFKYGANFDQSNDAGFDGSSDGGDIKQVTSPDQQAPPIAYQQPQVMDKAPSASQQTPISLGSGSLGVTKLPNGKFALGSGSLGYAALPPQLITNGLPLGTLPPAKAQAQPQQQSFTYDTAYLKGI